MDFWPLFDRLIWFSVARILFSVFCGTNLIGPPPHPPLPTSTLGLCWPSPPTPPSQPASRPASQPASPPASRLWKNVGAFLYARIKWFCAFEFPNHICWFTFQSDDRNIAQQRYEDPKIPMGVYGHSWVFMDFHGYWWILIDMHTYWWLCMDIHWQVVDS